MKGSDLAKLALAIASVVTAITIVLLSGSHTKTPNIAEQNDWFLDLKTGKLFAAKGTNIPPIDAESGSGQGVRAIVVGCGDCSEANRTIAYIQMFTDEARAIKAMPLSKNPDEHLSRMEKLQQGTLVAQPAAAGKVPRWTPMSTPEGLALEARSRTLCREPNQVFCEP